MPATPRLDRPLPTGTVTFLFTDIEGSTRLWEKQHAAMQAALANMMHSYVMRLSRTMAIFSRLQATAHMRRLHRNRCNLACLTAQRALLAHPWGELRIKSRMALHSGCGRRARR